MTEEYVFQSLSKFDSFPSQASPQALPKKHTLHTSFLRCPIATCVPLPRPPLAVLDHGLFIERIGVSEHFGHVRVIPVILGKLKLEAVEAAETVQVLRMILVAQRPVRRFRLRPRSREELLYLDDKVFDALVRPAVLVEPVEHPASRIRSVVFSVVEELWFSRRANPIRDPYEFSQFERGDRLTAGLADCVDEFRYVFDADAELQLERPERLVNLEAHLAIDLQEFEHHSVLNFLILGFEYELFLRLVLASLGIEYGYSWEGVEVNHISKLLRKLEEREHSFSNVLLDAFSRTGVWLGVPCWFARFQVAQCDFGHDE